MPGQNGFSGAFILHEVRGFQEGTQLSLEGRAGDVGFLRDGILDDGLVHAADFNAVFAGADVQAGTKADDAGDLPYVDEFHGNSFFFER